MTPEELKKLLEELKANLAKKEAAFEAYREKAEAEKEARGKVAAKTEDALKALGEKMDKKEGLIADMQKQLDAVEVAQKRGPKGSMASPEPEFKSLGENVIAGLQHRGKSLGTLGRQPDLRDKAKLFAERKVATGMGEDLGEDGGFLVHEAFAAPILESMMQGGEILSRVSMIEIGPGFNRTTIPMVDETSLAEGSLFGGIKGYWVAEAATITASQPALRQVTLGLNKIAALVPVSGELMQDATALTSFLNSAVPEVLQWTVEEAFVNGTGSGQPLGYINSGAIKSVAKEGGQANTTIVTENIEKMYAAMPAKFIPDAVWLANIDCFPQLVGMTKVVGTGGQPVWLPANQLAGQPHQTLFGRPLIYSEYCQTLGTTGDIQFVALKAYQAARKGGVKMDQSPHVYFTQDENALRFMLRIDGQSKWTSTLTPRHGTATRSPFVILAGRP